VNDVKLVRHEGPGGEAGQGDGGPFNGKTSEGTEGDCPGVDPGKRQAKYRDQSDSGGYPSREHIGGHPVIRIPIPAILAQPLVACTVTGQGSIQDKLSQIKF
jgi:hypothetical protein